MTAPRPLNSTQELKTFKDVREVWDLTYPDFVGAIGQENCPPGAMTTIRTWIDIGAIGADSHVLDLACSTGFSSRRLAKLAECSSEGLDLSAIAIQNGRVLAEKDGVADKTSYQVGDACQLPYQSDSFSHAVAGCCFGFIQNREQALREVARVLQPKGRLCIAYLAYRSEPPTELIDKVERCVGYRPDPIRTEAFWNKFFGEHFTLVDEHPQDSKIHSDEEIIASAAQTIQANSELCQLDEDIIEAVFQRLARDRLIFNDHRAYQRSAIQIWERGG